MSLHTIPSFRGLTVSLCLFLFILTPASALGQECTGAVDVGNIVLLSGSVGAGSNGVDGAKLTLTLTSEAKFVAGSQSATRGTWTVSNQQAVLDLGDLAPNESVSWRIDVEALSAGTATFTQVFTSAAGGRAESECFITINEPAPQPGRIRGTKWNDLNQNGARDSGEPGLSGWRIFVDTNGNGQRDGGEPSATTGSDGTYEIQGLDPDTYDVREELQTGWQQTFPGSGVHSVTVPAGTTVSGIDFGNAQLTAPKEADLSLDVDAMKEEGGPVVVGDTLAVEVSGENNGPDEADGVKVTITLDANGNWVLVPGSAEPCDNGGAPEQTGDGKVEWDMSQVPDGERFKCSVRVRTVAPGQASLQGSITSTTDDPNPGNNSDGFSTSVENVTRADLSVVKVAEKDTVFVGDTLSYVVTVRNNGPEEAPNTRIRDVVFSDSLMFIPTSVQPGCALSQNNGQIDCNLGTLAPGASVTIRYTGITKLVGVVTNLVDAVSDAEDPNVENNVASARALVRGGADVAVTKSVALFGFPDAPTDTVTVGTILEYTITVTNNGPETAFLVETDDLVFSDSLMFLPESVQENCTLGTATDDDTGLPLATMTCRHAAILEPGESETATYQAKVTKTGVVTNEAGLIRPGVRDLNPSNDVASVAVVVEATTIDFSLDAEASADNVDVGDAVTFDFFCSPDQAAEKCDVKVRFQTDEWSDVQFHQGMFTANGSTTPVGEDDEEKVVEVDPEGFPAGTTQIRYSFTGGYSMGGETYRGSFTMTADQANPNASITFENSTEGNDDPDETNDIIEILVTIDALATAVEEDPAAGIPEDFQLHGNYPNPFNPETTIRFDVRERVRVRLRVFNALGQLVQTLADEEIDAGAYRWVFDASGLPSGTYFYRIDAGRFSQTRAMVLLK